MRRKNHLFLLGMLFTSLVSDINAQETKVYTNPYHKYQYALSLYNENLYDLAKIQFDHLRVSDIHSELASNSDYYSASISAKLGDDNAETKILNFLYNHPTSSKFNLALLDLSTYYFNNEDYDKSLLYANKINGNVLNEEQLDKMKFQKAYGFFVKKSYANAKKEFETISETSKYSNQAKYYLGYISYDREDFTSANKYFNDVADIEKYQEKMGYYKADMYFKTGDFNKAIEEGLRQMPKSNELEKSELSKIIGESYFNLNQYTNALPYLLNYKGKNDRWSNTDFYQLGYAYYKQEDYTRAVSEFNKIIGGSDAVAQNAYYHLGESYLKLNQKTQALNAFKNASELDFNSRITEDAFANYAKLSYDIGNAYVSVPEVITSFLTKYPQSPYKTELETLLVDSYITTKNFKAALSVLEQKKSNINNRGVYQKVLFYRGVEVFNEANYKEALNLFNRSIAERHDNKFVARATYWRAEAQYQLMQYSDALSTLSTFTNLPQANETPEYKNAFYTLGYLNLRTDSYAAAASDFEKFIASTKDNDKKVDAQLRLADAYFASGNYQQAMNVYSNVSSADKENADYAAFQKILLQGYLQKNDLKISEIQQFLKTFPKSMYVDDALYELGATYANTKQVSQSINAFNQLINEHPKSPFISKAILRQGLVYFNSGDHSKAIDKFKKVVNDFPGSEDAIQAVQNARLAYNESGRTAEFASWVKTVPFVDISTAELEHDAYEVADKALAKGNKADALKAFKNYLQEYPNGSYALLSNYKVAEILFAENKISEAKTYYTNVISKGKNEYTEPTLVRLSTISLEEKSDDASINYLEKLIAEATNEQNKLFAQSNLMKVYFNQSNLDKASTYAKLVVANTKADNKVKSDAYVILGRQAFQSGNQSSAKTYYESLSKVAYGEAAAEALYYDAFFKTEDKKFEASNTVVQKLAKDYASYQYYGAKGLILMAKNFYGLKDSYQATYVLESVIANFKQYNDVVKEAQELLSKYKSQEAKRNSSVK